MFTAAKDDTISNLKNGTPAFRESTDDTKESLRNTANKAGHKVRELLYSTGDEISHAKETVTTQIRTNPLQSSLIALGVGYIFGTLFRR